jgi:hypothetical protein
MSSTGQLEHFGIRPVQVCFPNDTSRRLISTQYGFGSFAVSVYIVFSGDRIST